MNFMLFPELDWQLNQAQLGFLAASAGVTLGGERTESPQGEAVELLCLSTEQLPIAVLTARLCS